MLPVFCWWKARGTELLDEARCRLWSSAGAKVFSFLDMGEEEATWLAKRASAFCCWLKLTLFLASFYALKPCGLMFVWIVSDL